MGGCRCGLLVEVGEGNFLPLGLLDGEVGRQDEQSSLVGEGHQGADRVVGGGDEGEPLASLQLGAVAVVAASPGALDLVCHFSP